MDTIKDTIWLSLMADANIPTATKQELKKNKPMYEPIMAPLSKLPLGAPNW